MLRHQYKANGFPANDLLDFKPSAQMEILPVKLQPGSLKHKLLSQTYATSGVVCTSPWLLKAVYEVTFRSNLWSLRSEDSHRLQVFDH